jgi:hypothetical protein
MRTSDVRSIAPILVTWLAAGAAAASPRFPDTITLHLQLHYVPQCSLCHVAGNTGVGTARTPFAFSARDRGMVGGDTSLVAQALDAMARDGVDSDGDGVTDIAELLAGTDPNVYGPVPLAFRQDPSYGCSGARADLVALAGLLALLTLRRRSSRTRQPTRVACPDREDAREPHCCS